jgi:hypothetical protein
MEPLSLVIPTFSEAKTVGAVVREIPEAHRTDIIVANGDSGIQTIARDEGLVSSTQGKATHSSRNPVRTSQMYCFGLADRMASFADKEALWSSTPTSQSVPQFMAPVSLGYRPQ